VEWTNDTPADAGWYWFKANDTAPCVICIERDEGKLKLIMPIGGRVTPFYLEDESLPFINVQWSNEKLQPPE
jgi:hypothetical protein